MIKDNSKQVKKLDDRAKEGLYLDYDDNSNLFLALENVKQKESGC